MKRSELKKLILECKKELFEESSSLPLIVVDIQPAHIDYIDIDLDDFIEYLNNYSGSIHYIFNGEDLGYEGVDELSNWLIENGLDEDKLGDIEFIEKSYGFIRDAIDNGVDHSEIISLLEYMNENDEHDLGSLIEDKGIDIILDDLEFSLDEQNYLEQIQDGSISFYFPSVIDEIKDLPNSGIIVGGGRKECLLEIELLLNALDKRYKRNEEFIY